MQRFQHFSICIVEQSEQSRTKKKQQTRCSRKMKTLLNGIFIDFPFGILLTWCTQFKWSKQIRVFFSLSLFLSVLLLQCVATVLCKPIANNEEKKQRLSLSNAEKRINAYMCEIPINFTLSHAYVSCIPSSCCLIAIKATTTTKNTLCTTLNRHYECNMDRQATSCSNYR